jgi:hypothetical protein
MGLLGDHMTQEKTLEELQADLEAKAEALVDWCNKTTEVPYCQDEVVAVEAALERLYRLRKGQAERSAPVQPVAQSLIEALTHAVEIAEAKRPGTWDDLLRYRALLATPPAQPTPTDGWLQDGGLLYRLTDGGNPQNRDEINVTMADGSRSPEARARRAGELLDRIRAGSQAQTTLVQESDHSDELTIAYMSGIHRGKELAAQPAAPLTEPELRAVLEKTNRMIANTMRGPFWPELEQACRAIEAAHGIPAAAPEKSRTT